MRYRIKVLPLGSTVYGSQVARVIESKNSAWKVGSLMVHYMGWRTHTHITAQDLTNPENIIQPLPDLKGLPSSLGLGVVGMPGWVPLMYTVILAIWIMSCVSKFSGLHYVYNCTEIWKYGSACNLKFVDDSDRNTAYFGFLLLCEPKAGDTVLVNGAAGAVGSAVVQIAKIKGQGHIKIYGTDIVWCRYTVFKC